jgi:hypothetical protein
MTFKTLWFGFAFIAVFQLLQPAKAGWLSYDDFNDCMLDKMKGQNLLAAPRANTYCILYFACNSSFKKVFNECLTNSGSAWIYDIESCQANAAKECSK